MEREDVIYSEHSTQLDIPEDFKFGAGVSGMQVEGDDYNSDWSDNSLFGRTAQKRGREASQNTDYGNNQGKALPQELWDRIKSQAQDPENYKRGRSLGWEEGSYTEDLDIAQDLGLHMVRTSVERSRIEPQEGNFDPKAILHYRRFIEDCRKRGIEPVITLFHFSNPLWLSKKGGFESEGVAQNFADYVEKLLRAIDINGDIKHIIILNEPDIYIFMGYLYGGWPPEKKKSFVSALKVRRNLIEAHKRSYQKIKSYDESSLVSTSVNLVHVEPKSRSIQDRLGAELFRKLNNIFLPSIKGDIDFIALSQYMHNVKKGINPGSGNFQNKDSEPRSDLGWYLNPESIYHVLMYLKKYGLPIMVSENGLADSEDRQRPWFLRESIYQVMRAINDGADVRAYLHWSLVDNIELHEGKWPRFGLIGFDYNTGERTIRWSAREYKRIIASRKV